MGTKQAQGQIDPWMVQAFKGTGKVNARGEGADGKSISVQLALYVFSLGVSLFPSPQFVIHVGIPSIGSVKTHNQTLRNLLHASSRPPRLRFDRYGEKAWPFPSAGGFKIQQDSTFPKQKHQNKYRSIFGSAQTVLPRDLPSVWLRPEPAVVCRSTGPFLGSCVVVNADDSCGSPLAIKRNLINADELGDGGLDWGPGHIEDLLGSTESFLLPRPSVLSSFRIREAMVPDSHVNQSWVRCYCSFLLFRRRAMRGTRDERAGSGGGALES